MKNVSMKQNGKKLTIEIDTSKTFGESASGKTITVATTSGFTPSPNGDVKVSLNVSKAKE